MIQTKKATDKAIYERYKDCSTKELKENGMYEFMQYYRRGCKPKPKGTDTHRKARQALLEHRKDMSLAALAKEYETYEHLLYRIINERYRNVPEWKARIIATGDITPITRTEYEWSQHRKAAEKIKAMAETMTHAKIAHLLGITKSQVGRVTTDRYARPNRMIIEAVAHNN